ncbi:hypothetical protein AB3S75_031559 [Citrus x aurantiifolia]
MLVDLHRIGHKSDSFILASQAKQVFYATDPIDKKWSVVCFMPFRGIPNFRNDVDVHNTKEQVPFTKELPSITRIDVCNDDNLVDYVREDGIKQWISMMNLSAMKRSGVTLMRMIKCQKEIMALIIYFVLLLIWRMMKMQNLEMKRINFQKIYHHKKA